MSACPDVTLFIWHLAARTEGPSPHAPLLQVYNPALVYSSPDRSAYLAAEVPTYRPWLSSAQNGGYVCIGSGKRDCDGVIESEQESVHPEESGGRWSRALIVWQRFSD